MAEVERNVDEQAEPLRKAVTEVRETAKTHAAEISNSVPIFEPPPVKEAEETQKSE
jgi:hypothetical protein